jgi:nucleotide-binding universal stress UspA family protein
MNLTPEIRRILVPHDFGEPAECALGYAIALAGRLGATITVLHVYECPSYGFPDSMVATFEFESAVARAAQNALDGLMARARAVDVEIGGILRRGTPTKDIQAVAESIAADLIVMGTQGRHGLPRALLGSVAETVVRWAGCPVLTVHGRQKDEALAGATPPAEGAG